MKRIFTFSVFLCALCGLTNAAPSKPNIIFILTDDQGWGDAHFAGHPYVKTPHLDKFAAQSTWLRQFYVAATVCSPSRTAFMTAHAPARHHVHGHFADDAANAGRSMPNYLDPQVTTLPDLLKGAGYATGHFGKWHLGGSKDAPTASDYGFTAAKMADGNGPGFAEKKDPYFRAKSTALIVDETIRFIRERKGQPFYANVWTLLPHAPLKPTPEQLAEYETLAPKADDPAFGPWMQKYLAGAKDLKSQMQVFCASLTDLDTQLGRLFAALDEMKLADDTIIFISSDNGAEDYRIGNAANGGVGSTGPLRARKRSMYEGGIRTFGLVRWPGHIPAGRRDEVSVTSAVDFLPTVCKVAGITIPASVQPDGEDVSDIWLGTARPRTRPLHWEWLFRMAGDSADVYGPPPLCVRDGDWKLFCKHDGSRAQLYRIPQDIGEQHDRAREQPERVKALTAQALAWVKTLPPSPARDQVAATGQPQDAKPIQAKAKTKPASPAKPALDRDAIFTKWDRDKDGHLTLEEYTQGISPAVTDAPNRFKKFDQDQNHRLTREEFTKPQAK